MVRESPPLCVRLQTPLRRTIDGRNAMPECRLLTSSRSRRENAAKPPRARAICHRQWRFVPIGGGLAWLVLGWSVAGHAQSETPAAAGVTAAEAPAASPAAEPQSPAAAWKLERVTLTDGKTHDGLITVEGPAVIEFIEVHQPAGKPVGLVVLSIDRKSIETWTRLPPEQRELLATRIEGFRNRALIELRREGDLRLVAIRRDQTVSWQYQGDWFSLESTADEEMTRKSIVRIEQLFTAYRQILPPRLKPQTRLQFRLFGDTAEYRQFLGGRGLDLKNPAFFAADFNLVAAGSDMNRFVAELDRVRREHKQLRQEYARLLAETPSRVKELNDTLGKAGVPSEERQKISVAEQRKWKDEFATLESRIKAAERRNASRFQEVTGEMFGRLAHESFHAYLENFVYPRASSAVPRWLNEGLAQTFESGLLDGDSLRVDAPGARPLARLKSDLAGTSPLPLGDVLTADADQFISTHRGDAEQSSRLYLYSWGLAYFLAFEQPLLGTSDLERYVGPDTTGRSDIERFEALVGMPLAEFQQRWRGVMLGL